MVKFIGGVLHDRPPLTDAERWGESTPLQRIWAAADYLESAWQTGPPIVPQWGQRLGEWANAGSWSETAAANWDHLVDTVDVVSEAVYRVLAQRYEARNAVLVQWARRLYSPPAEDTAFGAEYDSDDLWPEVTAVLDAAEWARTIEREFRRSVDAAYFAAVRGALNRCEEQVMVAIAQIREAGTRALADIAR